MYNSVNKKKIKEPRTAAGEYAFEDSAISFSASFDSFIAIDTCSDTFFEFSSLSTIGSFSNGSPGVFKSVKI